MIMIMIIIIVVVVLFMITFLCKVSKMRYVRFTYNNIE